MAVSPEVVAYHRSFLSRHYFDNVKPPSTSERNQRSSEELEEIRLRDPNEFEKARRALAFMLRVPYRAGYYIPAARGDQGGPSSPRWVTGIPTDAQVGECMAPLNPSQGTIISPETGMAAMPIGAIPIKAYINGNPLYETLIYQKMDQDFGDYATSFEKVFSNLCTPSKTGFTPIVNSTYSVIGHIGTVSGGTPGEGSAEATFVIPEKFAHQTSLPEAMKNGIPVFVRNQAGTPEGWKPMGGYTTESDIEVRTTVDGEVTDFQRHDVGGLVTPWYSPTDFICIGHVLTKLGTKLGAKIVKSLLRRATMKMEARIVLEGATKKLATEAEKAEANAASQAAKQAAGDAAGSGGGAVQSAKRAVSEADLRPFPHKRFTGRGVTRTEMEALVRKTIQERPYLSQLAAAGKSNAPADNVMRLLREWANATGKSFMKVTNSTVQRLGSQGGGGWAIDSLTGKEVMILDEALFQKSSKFVSELLHELCYEAVREANGMPKLIGEGPIINANEWLETILNNGDRMYEFLR